VVALPHRLSFAVATLATAAVAAPAPALAERPKPDLSKVPKLKTIPAELAAAFPVLKRPRARKIPNSVLGSFTHSVPGGPDYGIDPRQTRAVYGLKGGPWYVMPGARGICIMVSAGGTCSPTERAVTYGISLFRYKPGAPRTTFLGFAPTGVTSVLVTLKAGGTVTGPLGAFNTYRLDVDSPFTQVAFARDGDDPTVIYPGAP
jgi:hypothetical protein